MENTKNPLLCDPETGACELPQADSSEKITLAKLETTAAQITYFTDPICSSCWGIEPQLRRLKLEFGNQIHIDYRMGGLLPDWSYNSGGISKPSDVAAHWDEVSPYYDMPIDGNIWLEDPLWSSYPPSIAFKAVQMQSPEKAGSFLRIIREMVFLEKKNICKWEHLSAAASSLTLNVEQLKLDMESQAKAHFEQDLKLARTSGVRAFPTLFFGEGINASVLVGAKPYEQMKNLLLKQYPKLEAMPYSKEWDYLFTKFPSLTAREFAEISGKERKQAEDELQQLTSAGKLQEFKTRNGSIWRKK
ncbi:protease adaptor protein SpxH [Bacteroidota bacterium]